MKTSTWVRSGVTAGLAFAAVAAATAAPVGSAFTYQGQLLNAGSPVTGAVDMIFTLWNDPTAGSQAGPTLTFDGAGGNPAPVAVSGGLFTVALDFGTAPFVGEGQWLRIQVRYPAGGRTRSLR